MVFDPVTRAATTETDSASLRGLECCLSAVRDHLPFVLSDGGKDLDGETVGGRIIDGDEVDLFLVELGDKRDCSG